jgi:hypothetical protein
MTMRNNIVRAHEMSLNEAMHYIESWYDDFEYIFHYYRKEVTIHDSISVILMVFDDGSTMDDQGKIIARNEAEWIEEFENHLENANYEAAMRMEQPDYWPGMAGDKG